MPGRGNVILASHNGNTKVSFFKRLEVLDNNDLAYIYYQGNKYEYEIYKSEIVDKTGKISINIDDSKNNLILITCKKGTNDKQIVYLARLVNSISIS
jgi:LPXTG-site transpeptidase (sortase) family protein